MKKVSLQERYLLETDEAVRGEIAEVIAKRKDTCAVIWQIVANVAFLFFMWGICVFSLFWYLSGFFDMLFKMIMVGTVLSTAGSCGILSVRISQRDLNIPNRSGISFIYHCTKNLMPLIFLLPFIESTFEISFSLSKVMLGGCVLILLLNFLFSRIKSNTPQETDFLNNFQSLAALRSLLGLSFYFLMYILVMVFSDWLSIPFSILLEESSPLLDRLMIAMLLVGIWGVVMYTLDNMARFACVYDKKYNRLRNLAFASLNAILIIVPLLFMGLDWVQAGILCLSPVLMLIFELVTFSLESKNRVKLDREDILDLVSGKSVPILSGEQLIKYRDLKNKK